MKFKSLFLAIPLCAALYSCDKIGSQEDKPEAGAGTYILNNGNWGDNDANIGIYDPAGKTYTASAFFAANNQKLGDLGQDVLASGDEVYIAMNGSQTIWVTDPQLKIKEQVNVEAEGSRLTPRYLALTVRYMSLITKVMWERFRALTILYASALWDRTLTALQLPAARSILQLPAECRTLRTITPYL